MEKTAVFHDVNTIVAALIDFSRRLSKSQLIAVEPKVREIISAMRDLKATRRVNTAQLERLEKVIDEGMRNAAQPKAKPKKEDAFVVVSKVWSLAPSRLTEHQKEKLKERRDDIPALYNGLSRSQDSVSLAAWAPKELVALAKPIENGKSQNENVPVNNVDKPLKTSNNNETIKAVASDNDNATEPKAKARRVSEYTEEEKKKRMERELSRIHIDAKVNPAVLPDRTRRVRRSSKENQSETPIAEKKAKAEEKPKKDIEQPSESISNGEVTAELEASDAQPPNEESPAEEPISTGESNGTASAKATESEANPSRVEEEVVQEVVEAEKIAEKAVPEAATATEINLSPCSDRSASPILGHGKSYMSALVFETTAESIAMSPEVNIERSQEFLNDTLNISPIVADPNPAEVAEASSKPDPAIQKSIETSSASVSELSATLTVERNPMKALRSTQASTPIQSAQSPISSKFKPQLTGRGAQLLQLINNKKQQKPLAAPSALSDSPQASATAASPSINKLQTAPIRDVMAPSEVRASHSLNASKLELLKFSRDLPSPHESPRFSILKRKARNEDDEDLIALPATKRKRVSFNFPLSETVEFVADDGAHAPAAVGDDESSNRPSFLSNGSPAMRFRNKLKRRTRNENAKEIVKLEATAAGDKDATDKLDNDDDVSIEHIKECLGSDGRSEAQEAQRFDSEITASECAEPTNKSMEIESEKESPAKAADDAPAALASFSDDEIFKHLFAKYNLGEIVRRQEELSPHAPIDPQSARVLSNKLSTVMSSDAAVRASVLEELAEQHSVAFLDHAVAENLCSTVCERLLSSPSNGALDYMTAKFSSDEHFRSRWLSRVPTKHFADPALVIGRDAAHRQPAPPEIAKLVSSIFEKFAFNSDQFEDVMALYLRNKLKKGASEA